MSPLVWFFSLFLGILGFGGYSSWSVRDGLDDTEIVARPFPMGDMAYVNDIRTKCGEKWTVKDESGKEFAYYFSEKKRLFMIVSGRGSDFLGWVRKKHDEFIFFEGIAGNEKMLLMGRDPCSFDGNADVY